MCGRSTIKQFYFTFILVLLQFCEALIGSRIYGLLIDTDYRHLERHNSPYFAFFRQI